MCDQQAAVRFRERGGGVMNVNWAGSDEVSCTGSVVCVRVSFCTKSKKRPYVDATSVRPSDVCLSVCVRHISRD